MQVFQVGNWKHKSQQSGIIPRTIMKTNDAPNILQTLLVHKHCTCHPAKRPTAQHVGSLHVAYTHQALHPAIHMLPTHMLQAGHLASLRSQDALPAGSESRCHLRRMQFGGQVAQSNPGRGRLLFEPECALDLQKAVVMRLRHRPALHL